MRLAELNELKISDFDFKENKFVVLGKGSKERTCYLNANAKEILQNGQVEIILRALELYKYN